MYERKVVKIDDSDDLQAQILSHHGFRFITAIPWLEGKALLLGRSRHSFFLVFERIRPPAEPRC